MHPTTEGDIQSAVDREAVSLNDLLRAARQIRDVVISRSADPPKFVLQSAQTMAHYLGMPDHQWHGLLPSMAFSQAYLPSALAKDTRMLTEASTYFPRSYHEIHTALSDMESHPQLVVAMFHMAGLPLVAALLAAASTQLHPGRSHALIARRNIALLQVDSWRWVYDACEPISTDRSGLRQLVAGLSEGAIKRLLIMVDGPHPPGSAGTRALTNVNPNLAFKTGLLTRIVSMGIPVLPLVHFWEADALVLRWQPLLKTEEQAVTDIELTIEELLGNHPEQWLNWTAPSIRT